MFRARQRDENFELVDHGAKFGDLPLSCKRAVDGMRRIELAIASAPESNPVLRGLRGVRKACFALPGRGKSGGGRAIYYLAVSEAIFMMTAYPKSERDDLSPDQRKAILAVIDNLKKGA